MAHVEKALSLWQPWASLVAVGAKTIETRAWGTSYRGPLAIHAAKTTRGIDEPGYLDAHTQMVNGAELIYITLPLGAVVATCYLVDVVPTENVFFDGRPGSKWIVLASPGRTSVHSQSGNEPLGDFTPGRYAWLLDNIEALPEPIPARGRQQLWNWER